MANKKEEIAAADRLPHWFYYVSVISAFLFTMFISIYSAIHFENIRYMNVMFVFLFISTISFFLISGVYFHTEKMGYHVLPPVLFFSGLVSLVVYAYKAVDASNIVRYSIIYTIIVIGISLFILLPKKKYPLMRMQKSGENPAKKAR